MGFQSTSNIMYHNTDSNHSNKLCGSMVQPTENHLRGSQCNITLTLCQTVPVECLGELNHPHNVCTLPPFPAKWCLWSLSARQMGVCSIFKALSPNKWRYILNRMRGCSNAVKIPLLDNPKEENNQHSHSLKGFLYVYVLD